MIEADESDGSFLAGPRAAALVTNIEPDHLEFWGGWDQLRRGFRRFLAETDGPTSGVRRRPGGGVARPGGRRGRLRHRPRCGLPHRRSGARLGGVAVRAGPPGGSPRRGRACVPGLHNALDAAGALAVAGELGVDLEAAARGLAGFTGAARRFERRGTVAGVEFVDDYAHLPTEVRAALAAGRSGGWSRVVAVFQPHRYSRTEALWEEFATAFDDADVLVLTEIYPAGEAPQTRGDRLAARRRGPRPAARPAICGGARRSTTSSTCSRSSSDRATCA